MVARLARELLERLDALNLSIDALEAEIAALVEPMAPALLSIQGCGALTAAKIVAEHGGRIELMDAPAVAEGGRGAMMRIYLPRLDASRSEQRREPLPAPEVAPVD